MTQQDSYRKIGSEISRHLLRGEFDSAAVTEDREGKRQYDPWYAELLSAMSLLIGSDPVVFAHTTYASDAEDFNVYVFTEHLVVVAKIDPQMDGFPLHRPFPEPLFSR